jgi:hypothetical protein
MILLKNIAAFDAVLLISQRVLPNRPLIRNSELYCVITSFRKPPAIKLVDVNGHLMKLMPSFHRHEGQHIVIVSLKVMNHDQLNNEPQL